MVGNVKAKIVPARLADARLSSSGLDMNMPGSNVFDDARTHPVSGTGDGDM